MSRLFYALAIVLTAIAAPAPSPAQEIPDLRQSIAKEFAGVYCFNYLFVENGVPYVDVADHLQFLELDKFENAPRVTLFNQTGKAKNADTTTTSFIRKNTN